MDHLIAVGNVTKRAEQRLRELGGLVHYVSSVPPVLLVSLPDPVFEYMDSGSEVRIKVRASTPFIWRGHHPGPQWTSVEQTELLCECGEPREAGTQGAEAYLDLDDHPF